MRVELNLRFDEIADRAEEARAQALSEIGEHIRARSVAIAPRRSGAMAASARSEAGRDRVRVGYRTPYAAYQHENVRLNHPNGGRAKFLSSVAESPEAAAHARGTLAGALRGKFH